MKKIEIRTKQAILQQTIQDVKARSCTCYDFELLQSPMESDMWFMRYTYAKMLGDKPRQYYRWLCFNSKGEQVQCDPKLEVQHENDLKGSMEQVEAYEDFAVLKSKK